MSPLNSASDLVSGPLLRAHGILQELEAPLHRQGRRGPDLTCQSSLFIWQKWLVGSDTSTTNLTPWDVDRNF